MQITKITHLQKSDKGKQQKRRNFHCTSSFQLKKFYWGRRTLSIT